jgi:hypothetical protein
VDTEVELGNFSADDNGLAIGGGIRTRISQSFELDAGLKFVDMDDSGSDTGVAVTGRWYFHDSFALSFGADLNDYADTFRIGFRAEF